MGTFTSRDDVKIFIDDDWGFLSDDEICDRAMNMLNSEINSNFDKQKKARLDFVQSLGFIEL